jgi:hypothetical protein
MTSHSIHIDAITGVEKQEYPKSRTAYYYIKCTGRTGSSIHLRVSPVELQNLSDLLSRRLR